MNRAEVQRRIFDPGKEQIQCAKPHGFTVYMNGTQGRSDHPGFRCVVKAAQIQVLRNRNLHLSQYLQKVYSHEVVDADKDFGEFIHFLKLLGQVFLIICGIRVFDSLFIAKNTIFFHGGKTG